MDLLVNEVLDKLGTLSWSVHGHTVATVLHHYHLRAFYQVLQHVCPGRITYLMDNVIYGGNYDWAEGEREREREKSRHFTHSIVIPPQYEGRHGDPCC